MRFLIPTSRDVTIRVNGKKVALVQGYDIKFYRYELETEILIEIDRVLTPEGLSDEVDFFNLSNFAVSFEYPGFEVSYGGCEWVEIYEYCGKDGQIHERAVITALNRTQK